MVYKKGSGVMSATNLKEMIKKFELASFLKWNQADSSASVPLHSAKVAVWCGLTVSLIVGSLFFVELGPADHITCTVNSKLYESLLCNQITPTPEQCVCLDRIAFIQDGATQHTAKLAMQLGILKSGS